MSDQAKVPINQPTILSWQPKPSKCLLVQNDVPVWHTRYWTITPPWSDKDLRLEGPVPAQESSYDRADSHTKKMTDLDATVSATTQVQISYFLASRCFEQKPSPLAVVRTSCSGRGQTRYESS